MEPPGKRSVSIREFRPPNGYVNSTPRVVWRHEMAWPLQELFELSKFVRFGDLNGSFPRRNRCDGHAKLLSVLLLLELIYFLHGNEKGIMLHFVWK